MLRLRLLAVLCAGLVVSLNSLPVTAEEPASCSSSDPQCSNPCPGDGSSNCGSPCPPENRTCRPSSPPTLQQMVVATYTSARECEAISFGDPPRINQCVWDMLTPSAGIGIP